MKEKLADEIKSWDPEAEEVEIKSLYIKLKKPKRTEKPTRKLTTLRPKSEEVRKLFKTVEEPYFMNLDPNGSAGNHYHDRKIEVICPTSQTPIYLHLQSVQNGDRETLQISDNPNSDYYEEYLILPGVAHRIENPSIIPVSYLVLSNTLEKDALESEDVIPFEVIQKSKDHS